MFFSSSEQGGPKEFHDYVLGITCNFTKILIQNKVCEFVFISDNICMVKRGLLLGTLVKIGPSIVSLISMSVRSFVYQLSP